MLLSIHNRAARYSDSESKLKISEFTQSLKYAALLQANMMPDPETQRSVFPQSFALYEPCETVSGDFYTVYENNLYKYVFVGDCAGHGVRGAMLATLSLGMINVIMQNGVLHPSEILQLLDKKILSAINGPEFKQVAKGRKMIMNGIADIAIVRLEKETNQLIFAGANQKILVNYSGTPIILSGSKYPIAGAAFRSDRSFPFQSKNLKKGDTVYLTSDGFQDQLGGDEDRKFSSKRLHRLLAEISHLPMNEQKMVLQNTLEDWKKGEELNDDICLFGLKV